MSEYEVSDPILNSPFLEPGRHWFIQEGKDPQLIDGRRPSFVYPPEEGNVSWTADGRILKRSETYSPAYEMVLVNLIRERVKQWREAGYDGASRTTQDLLSYWRREGREKRLFYAQLEAAETIIFLTEARQDFLQGLSVPRDEPSDDRAADGYAGFKRYACKMATGSGKTTLMGMVAAWSILNKVNDRSDARFSDVVLAVCPNVTIRDRLRELDPDLDESSIYRTRDLVPIHQMATLRRGRVLVTNWHVFEPKQSENARVVKTGVPKTEMQRIKIGAKTTTARGKKYLTEEELRRQIAAGLIEVKKEERDKKTGTLTAVLVEITKHVESDTALVNRLLDKEVGGKQNILIFNDEAHHAYRIQRDESNEKQLELDIHGDEKEAEEFFQEATVWIDGLDRINKLRGINFCVDLSATPFYLGRVGQETGKPFPWVVSDFGLTDAIESGLVKIPQLAVRDTTGADVPGFFNIWRWVMDQLTPSERGGSRASPKPEAVLKYASQPIAMLGGLWEQNRQEWAADTERDNRPPVFILVCKNTAIAKVVYEWLADGKCPSGIAPSHLESLRNRNGETYTIRVDSKVVQESDFEEAKGDETRWMRATLDTVGRAAWPEDRQGRPIYPEGFEELAGKLGRPLHPPGRDVRCIVSVGMLTEGWDCNTVTHIIGLRPFMSQLLCEQVVGRGLRRVSYDLNEADLFSEEVAKVFGVPFSIVPFKTSGGNGRPREKRHHVYALPGKAKFKISYPRVEGYTQAIRNRVSIDWDTVAPLVLDPLNIPPEVEVKGTLPNNKGRYTLCGPGKIEDVTMNPYRSTVRLQQLVFEMASALTKDYVIGGNCEVSAHVLFPQIMRIVDKYAREKIKPLAPAQVEDAFLSPYYGWVIERLVEAIQPDSSQGEAPEIPRYETHRGPGSTDDVDTWTAREVREPAKCHLNYVIMDTRQWEESAAYFIDKSPHVEAFVKNAGLGFAIPYINNGAPHDYVPDFVIRLSSEPPCHLILETKGFDDLEDVKRQAAERWVAAVNADGSYGCWQYAVAKKPTDVDKIIENAVEECLRP